jgi:hypothetical protein
VLLGARDEDCLLGALVLMFLSFRPSIGQGIAFVIASMQKERQHKTVACIL